MASFVNTSHSIMSPTSAGGKGTTRIKYSPVMPTITCLYLYLSKKKKFKSCGFFLLRWFAYRRKNLLSSITDGPAGGQRLSRVRTGLCSLLLLWFYLSRTCTNVPVSYSFQVPFVVLFSFWNATQSSVCGERCTNI